MLYLIEYQKVSRKTRECKRWTESSYEFYVTAMLA